MDSLFRKIIDFNMLCRRFLARAGYLALLGGIALLALPDTGSARVFAVFGPENFARSGSVPTIEVRQFQVQHPKDSEFTMHVFYGGVKPDFQGIVPSARVNLNDQPVFTPGDFNRNNHYLKKAVTLSELNTLSVELLGKPGSGVRVVITGRNDEPRIFDYTKSVLPDGIDLLGGDLNYSWSVLEQPDAGNATLSAPNASSTSLRVDRPGSYSLLLKISGATWEETFTITLAGSYPAFVPVPVETRISLQPMGGQFYSPDYAISVGPNTYLRPLAVACGSTANTGFQVLVLDRSDLSRKDHKTFNTPCGNQSMIDFLNSLANTSSYPVAPLVIVSSLNMTKPSDVCGNSSSCPLGHAIEALGGTTVFSKNYSETTWVNYSLIGIPGLGASNGTELNSWDHRAFYAGDPKINADIMGYFVPDINLKWAFTYPDFVQIETRPQAQDNPPANVIKVGTDSYQSSTLKSGASGGFQVLILDRDNLKLPNYPLSIPTNATFSTNATGALGDQEQLAMYNHLNTLKMTNAAQRFVVIVASVGVPITYKSATFANLIRLIGDYYGATTGILNKLGAAGSDPTVITTYSLVGMNNQGNGKYGLGALDTVEASDSGQSLKVVMHKDKQGWYGPVTTYSGAAGAASSPDFGLLPVTLQPATAWPLPNPSDPAYQQQLYAYQYISDSVGIAANGDIRSHYTENVILPDYQSCNLLAYPSPDPVPYFSPAVFTAMRSQLCNEFNYVSYVNQFRDDMHSLIANIRVSSGNNMGIVYDAVKSTVYVDPTDQVKWDALYVIRAMLAIGGKLDPAPAATKAMGVVNGLLWLGMHLAKGPAGPDATSIDAQYQNLQDQMNNLWANGQTGNDIALDMVKSDWGKLQYVGVKLTTDQAHGGWMYHDTDLDQWTKVVTDSLESYYFQSLLPAVWKIDYWSDSTTIALPKNFEYKISFNTGCHPYCEGSSTNPTAFWVDSFTDKTYSWYVLENGINLITTSSCGYVRYSSSSALRAILFGTGDWNDSSNNRIGVNLNLSEPFFYERWLPASAYTLPNMPGLGIVDEGFAGSCWE